MLNPVEFFLMGYTMAMQAQSIGGNHDGVISPVRLTFGPYDASFGAFGDTNPNLPLSLHDLAFEIEFGQDSLRVTKTGSSDQPHIVWDSPPTSTQEIAVFFVMNSNSS